MSDPSTASRSPHSDNAEIRDRFGVLPNFFRLAPEAPEITDNLWGFAKFGYLDNPLPPLFKERLFVYLSRFCEVRYCISRHVGFLAGLGRPAGDAAVAPESVEQVVRLLQRALPRGDELEPHLAALEAGAAPLPDPPAPETDAEISIFACATHVFLQTPQAPRALEALRGVFEPALFQHLLVFLAFVRTAHFWTKVHPELQVEDDITSLLAVQESLAECVLNLPEEMAGETTALLLDELASLRRERALREEVERANAALTHERERLRTTLASIGDAVITTDPAGAVTSLNAVAESLTGWSAVEAAGLPLAAVFRIVDEETRATVDNPAARALRDGAIVGLANHTVLIARDGTEIPIDDSAAPIRGADGTIIGCVLVFRNVTERRRTEQRLAEVNRRLEESVALLDILLAKAPVGLGFVDCQLRLVRMNDALAVMNRLTPEDLGRPIRELAPAIWPEIRPLYEQALAGEPVTNVEIARQRADVAAGTHHRLCSYYPVRVGSQVAGVGVVLVDITERKNLENALQRYVADLSEADRRKDEFLATLAHELRNPLAPIRNGLQLMQRASGQPEIVEQARAMMEQQLAQLVRLVDDLMDVSRITSGKVELRRERIPLAAVVDSAVEASRTLIEELGHRLTVSLPAEGIVIDADPTRLAQVLANLINNACKYSDRNGIIAIAAAVDEPVGAPLQDGNSSAKQRLLRLSVTDSGIGIAAEHLPRIFDMFAQPERSLGRSQGGLGIGLTLVKQLVEMHGGSVAATSAGPGKGSEFVVRLPLLSDAAPAPSAAPEATGAPPASPRRILIVDDNRNGADSLGMLLSLMGHEVRTAYDGLAGIGMAEDYRPEVVVLDLGLPKLDGYEVCRRIRQQPWGSETMLIAVTGWGQAEDRRRTGDAGFDHHLVKPVDPQALEALLGESMPRRR